MQKQALEIFIRKPCICVGDNATLEVKECIVPSEIKWNVFSNLQITNQDGSSVEVKAISNGEAFIKATFENGQSYTKTFWVGVPELDPMMECVFSDDCWEICTSTYASLENEMSVKTIGQLNQQVTDWQWEKVTTNFNWTTSDNTATFMASQTGYISFRVRAKNKCGWSEWLISSLKVEKCDNNNPLREQFFRVYPNPTSYELNINLINPQNSTRLNASKF